jgi:hypothetical protein
MKKVTITVSNKQLDSLEDLLYCENTQEEFEKKTEICKELWTNLVKEFDRE